MTQRFILIAGLCALLSACSEQAESNPPANVAAELSEEQRSTMFDIARQISDEIAPKIKTMGGAIETQPLLKQVYQSHAGDNLKDVIIDDGRFYAGAYSGSGSWSYDSGTIAAKMGDMAIYHGKYSQGLTSVKTVDTWVVLERVKLASGEADLVIVFLQ